MAFTLQISTYKIPDVMRDTLTTKLITETDMNNKIKHLKNEIRVNQLQNKRDLESQKINPNQHNF